jgi:serine/threonine-protein kinase
VTTSTGSTPEPQTVVAARICPGCDAEPPATGAPICPACGSRLVELRPPADALIGQVVDGRFEIRDRLGEGGMGTVYRAWQRSIGREVAIKIIDHRHVRDAMAVRRFLREAKLSSQLSQPNTVSVFDFGQADDGRLFIAMELIRGRTLADVVKDAGRLPVARAARIALQLCDALEAAHGLHIVHRDLKPSNVIVLDDPPGRDLIKVLDFGLAKSMTEDETESTQTGFVVGTPRYMAPEVALGADPSPQSDLYAVGVMLGELTTGKKMWDLTTFSALVAAKNRGTPIRAEIPPSVRGLVDRLIDPEPARRPARAAELRPLLQAVVDAGEAADAPAPPAAVTAPMRAMAAPPDEVAPRPRVTAPTVAQRGPRGDAAGDRTDGDGDGDAAPAAPAPVPAVTASVVLTSEQTRARRSRVTALALAVAGLAVAGGVAAIALTRGGGQAAPADATRAAAPPPAPDAAVAPDGLDAGVAAAAPDAAPVVDEVVVTVRSRPTGAAITLDGRPAGTAPAALRVPRGDAPVRIEVTARGRTAARAIVPDRDHTLELTLPRPRGAGGSTSSAPGGGDETPF